MMMTPRLGGGNYLAMLKSASQFAAFVVFVSGQADSPEFATFCESFPKPPADDSVASMRKWLLAVAKRADEVLEEAK